MAQSDFTSHSFMISQRRSCSICRSRSELELELPDDPEDDPPPLFPAADNKPELDPDKLDEEVLEDEDVDEEEEDEEFEELPPSPESDDPDDPDPDPPPPGGEDEHDEDEDDDEEESEDIARPKKLLVPNLKDDFFYWSG